MNRTTQKLTPINDQYFKNLKADWFNNGHPIVTVPQFIPIANEWFKSTKINALDGWDEFPYTDVVLGCTHFIESFVIKYGWQGFQILPQEYAYYGLMGKHGTPCGELEPNKPLIISLPNWRYADLRPEWHDLLVECEQKNIDIHIDFAWITTSTGIEVDLSHPNIKSFAMSMSKYSMEWNRIGLRWTRQRTMDSITIFNHFHGDVNSSLTSCGAYMMQNIPRDYAWNTYGDQHRQICKDLGLLSTKLIHVAELSDHSAVVGIGNILSSV
jgi:hypothetical protein